MQLKSFLRLRLRHSETPLHTPFGNSVAIFFQMVRSVTIPLNGVLYGGMKLALVDQLYDAFSEAVKPSGNSIAPHRCPECNRIRDDFDKYQSRDVPDRIIRYHRDALPLLSPEALRHYLPRYFEYALTTGDGTAWETIVFELDVSEDEERDLGRLHAFSNEEREAIVSYLNYIARDADNDYGDEIKRALTRWAI